MKFKLPEFLEDIATPVEGEVAMRNFIAGTVSDAGSSGRSKSRTLDLFAGEGPCADILVGIDEVGRGPFAGPVVACAAVLKAPDIMPALNDSKKLTRKKREAMFDDVKEACACYAIASASVEEIDMMNILEADFLAMRRALQALGLPGLNETAPEIPIEVKGSFADVAVILEGRSPDRIRDTMGVSGKPAPRVFIAVDGNLKIHGVSENIQMPVVKGDGRIASISAASILAKVFRDRYMDKLAEKYPEYGFEENAGYRSPKHIAALRKLGFTPVHRRSFHIKELEGFV